MARYAYLKLLSATIFIQCCWMQVSARKELQRQKQAANELSIKSVGDSRMNHIEERGNDTIQARFDSDFGIKFSTVQFYVIDHNSKSNRQIKLKLYQKILEVLVFVGVNFQLNQNLGRICYIGQNRLYNFFYSLPFNLWTFYLARILFLQGCDNLFWESPSSIRICN